jgi:hypothetical protein
VYKEPYIIDIPTDQRSIKFISNNKPFCLIEDQEFKQKENNYAFKELPIYKFFILGKEYNVAFEERNALDILSMTLHDLNKTRHKLHYLETKLAVRRKYFDDLKKSFIKRLKFLFTSKY